jgi:hypothetical protein
LLLSSVLLSPQIQHSLNTAAAATVAAVAVPMAAVAEASMVAAVEASTVVAALMAARGLQAELQAEEVTPKAAALVVDQRRGVTEPAAVHPAALELAAIPVRPEIIRRMFVPQSTMASGIRSATPVVPRV